MIQQGLGSHDQAGGADTALDRAVIEKGLLKRMKGPVPGKALNCFHPCAPCLEGGIDTAVDGYSIHQHGADTAFSLVTADFGSGQPQVLAQYGRQIA